MHRFFSCYTEEAIAIFATKENPSFQKLKGLLAAYNKTWHKRSLVLPGPAISFMARMGQFRKQ